MSKIDEQTKLMYSSVGASLFALVSLPNVYYYTNKMSGALGFSELKNENCPTSVGKLVHGLIFLLLSYGVMKVLNNKRQPEEQVPDVTIWKYSLFGTLLYFFVADDDTYGLTNRLFSNLGWEIANKAGCPNLSGILTHSLVYLLILFGVMHFP